MSSSTNSLWAAAELNRKGAPLSGAVACDVCVVGAGIAGLTTAYLLAREGRAVVVLDAQPEVAGGETMFTTAHLASAIDDRFHRLIEVRGEEAARLAYQAHAAAIDRIERAAKEEQIDCDFARLDGYLIPGAANAGDIDRELDAATRLGVPVARVERPHLPRVAPGPWLRFANQGRFHPLKYLAGLRAALTRRGGLVFTRAHAEAIEGGDRARARCRGGAVVTAAAVVVATNTPLNSGVSLNSKLAAYTTYALAAPVAGTPLDALLWDTEDPYHYVRWQPAEDGPGYLIVGGEDHKTGQAADQPERWRRLEAWARPRFGEMGPVEMRWSGQVFETLDGLAHIGPDPEGKPNVYIATGDSGMGLTHGTIAGMLLADLIQGRTSPWAELFKPARASLKAAGTYVSENVNMARQYADWVTGGDISSEGELARGQGAVLRSGLRKLAVYRDDDGRLHRHSATCPHMGCIVHFNPGEQTFDCPCHGSRFSADGRVVHGPAVDDLGRVAE